MQILGVSPTLSEDVKEYASDFLHYSNFLDPKNSPKEELQKLKNQLDAALENVVSGVENALIAQLSLALSDKETNRVIKFLKSELWIRLGVQVLSINEKIPEIVDGLIEKEIAKIFKKDTGSNDPDIQ